VGHCDSGASGNRILSNSIFSDTFAIDLNNDSATPNDAATVTRVQQSTKLSCADLCDQPGSDTTIEARLTARLLDLQIEFFSTPRLTLLALAQARLYRLDNVTTDGSGDASFIVNTGSATPSGQFITATATNNSTNDTSEFSYASRSTP